VNAPQEASFNWKSQNAIACPSEFVVLGDQSNADEALSLARQGKGLLWQGDFHLARQMLVALTKRVEVRKKAHRTQTSKSLSEQFHAHRLQLTQQHQLLNRLCIQIEGDHTIALPKAPQVKDVLQHVWGHETQPLNEKAALPWRVSLKELLGWIGAHEWFKNGLPISELGPSAGKIHPHFGVFAPSRKDYLELVYKAPLPSSKEMVFDIGVGTGVLSAVLARRGVQHIIATDLDPRALACAADNLQRLRCSGAVTLLAANLFPDVEAMASDSPFRASPAFASLHTAAPLQADLIVCNPPWLPGKPSSPIEGAIYDFNSQMLKGFLAQAKAHLSPHGEAWLILSDLAEHLGLRTREALLGWIAAGGLQVLGRMDTRAKHPKAMDPTDPLYAARSAELTSLWRLGHLV